MLNDKGVFTDGKDGQLWPCSYEWNGQSIRISLNGIDPQEKNWSFQDLSSVEQNGASVLLSHRNGASLMASGPSAARLMEEHQLYLEQYRKRQGRLSKGSLYMILGISGAVLLAGILLYVFVLPWLAEKAVLLVPVETEIALGESLTESLTAEALSDDSVNHYLKEFISRLELNQSYPIRVRLIRSEEINAFALPGGNIFIYSGLLEKLESPEELVALIGHEVTHVVQRHSLKSMSRSLASGLLFSFLLGDASGIVAQADQFKQLGYSRELETEADDYGLRLMRENGVDPSGMLRLLEVLQKENTEMPQLMKYLSTHPDTEDRIRNIRSQIGAGEREQARSELNETFDRIKSVL